MHSFADAAVTIDAQVYGTTVIVERFVMTTVTPYVATDGEVHLPVRDDPKHPEKVTGMPRMKTIPIPPDILAAIRAPHTVSRQTSLREPRTAARAHDRTVSYVVRAQLREFLRSQQRGV